MWCALQRKVRSLGAALDGKQKAQLQAAHTNWQAGAASAAAYSSQDGAPHDADNASASVEAPAGARASTAGAEDNGGDVASLIEERARRENEARRARQRSAFGDLFACGKRAAGTSGGTSGGTADGTGGGVGGVGGGSCLAGGSQQVIDLSGDDDEPVTSTSRGPANVVAADVAVAAAEMSDARGWFAVSSLTGRLHAFGLTDAPQHGAANALPLAVQDEDETALPAVFTEPSVLRAARRWLLEWGELTPAQKVKWPAIITEPHLT
jgi:hypothetical protein